jgi:hypothetical protein
MTFVMLLVLLGVVVARWVFYQHSETQRELALDQLAGRFGMNFRFGLPGDLKGVISRFRAIEKAKEAGGDFQAGINTITGVRRGRKVAFFDYEGVSVTAYRTRRGLISLWDDQREYRTTHVRSAVAARIGVPVQPVLIRPERLVDKAVALVGYEDIGFASLPEFSDRFYVNSPDSFAARRVVTPALARFFLDHVRCTADFVGPWLLLHDNGKLSVSRAAELIELASRLAERVEREQSGSR